MKRVGLWAAIGIGLFITVGLLTVEPGYTEEKDQAPTCTLATLEGRYLVAFSGFVVPPFGGVTQQTPLAGAAVVIFDGEGSGTFQSTVSFNGTITPYRDVSVRYTVNADCSGTYTIELLPTVDINNDIFIAPNGAEFSAVQTDTGGIGAEVWRRVAHK